MEHERGGPAGPRGRVRRRTRAQRLHCQGRRRCRGQIRADLQHFVRQTTGKAMVMGRKTFDSACPACCPAAATSSSPATAPGAQPGAEVVHTPEEAFKVAGGRCARRGDRRGGHLRRCSNAIATRLEITEVARGYARLRGVHARPRSGAIWERGASAIRTLGRRATTRPIDFVTYVRRDSDALAS